MRRLGVGLLAACVASSLAAPAIAGSEDGPELAAVCASCHRLDGQQTGTPTITGRPAEELVRSLQGFRRGGGANHIMTTVCRMLSDEEIATLARYLGTIGREDAHR